MRRLAIASVLFASAACGLTFSPGDYREPGAGTDGGLTADANALSDGGTNDAGPDDGGEPLTRLALFTGRRDAVTGEGNGQATISETLLTTIGPDGSLGPITYATPPPVNALWSRGIGADGRVYLHNASTLVHAPLTDGVSGPWVQVALPSAPEREEGVRPWLLGAAGFASGRSFAGAPNPWLLPLTADGRTAGPWAQDTSTPQVTVARGNTTVVRVGGHVYLVGGNLVATDGTVPAFADVEVAPMPDRTIGVFHPTTSLPPLAEEAGAYAIYEAVTVAGPDRLFLLGGQTTSSASSLSDVALVAKVRDPATGDLDPWVVLPRLPQPMSGFAAILRPNWLVIIGGQIAGNKTSAAALRLAVNPDGTYGTTWENAGALPEGRSSIVGVTY